MNLSFLDCAKMYLAFLLAGFSLDLIQTIWRLLQIRKYKKRSQNHVNIPGIIPPSDEVIESSLNQQAEIMARAMIILNKQIRDKIDGEIDLESPTDG